MGKKFESRRVTLFSNDKTKSCPNISGKQKSDQEVHFKYIPWTIWEWQVINYSRKMAGNKHFSSIQLLWKGKKKTMFSDKNVIYTYTRLYSEKLKWVIFPMSLKYQLKTRTNYELNYPKEIRKFHICLIFDIIRLSMKKIYQIP